MVHVYFVIAFVLLWALLAGFAYLLLVIVRKIDRGDEDGPQIHGL